MEKFTYRIAIDGPVASGKGTIAPALAQRLAGFYLPTGMMYRCLALNCIHENIDLKDENKVMDVLKRTEIRFVDGNVLLNGVDVTSRIKDEVISMGSSTVSTLLLVRSEMVQRQRRVAEEYISQGKTVVAEGRDTGTKLFPDADVKIFLTARPEIRAQRRCDQLDEAGITREFSTVLADLKKRDEQDYTRKIDPLVREPEKFGYTVIDNSDQTEVATVESIVDIMQKKGLVI